MAKEPITFRVDPAVGRLLKLEASRAGKRLARHVADKLTASLSGSELDAIREELLSTRQEVEQLRDDLVKSLEVVLIASGFTPDVARETVSDLRRNQSV